MPNHASRIVVQLALVIASLVFVVGRVLAQPPYELPNELQTDATETELQEVVVPLSDAVKRKIADALARDGHQNDPIGSTGDPILDDVLNVIRRQGSVLDGSALDPRAPQRGGPAAPNLPSTEQSPPPLPRGGEPVPMYPLQTEEYLAGPEARFHVAESLLRAARELAAMPGRNQQRDRLIAAMREQATVLLIDEFSHLPSDSQ